MGLNRGFVIPTRLLGHSSRKKFDIIGTLSEGFVGHVGLLRADSELESGKKAEVYQMRPPLRLNEGSTMEAHLVGWLDLTVEEREAIEEWLIQLGTLVSDCRYIALPAVKKRFDINGRLIGWRFSCAGFIRQAYLQAQLMLTPDEEELPQISLQDIQKIWSFSRVKLARYGLEGGGPWRVLVPGYLIHAVDQPQARLPFRPACRHLRFP